MAAAFWQPGAQSIQATQSPDGWVLNLESGLAVIETSYVPTYTSSDFGSTPFCAYNHQTGFEALPCQFLFPTAGKRWTVCRALPNGKCRK